MSWSYLSGSLSTFSSYSTGQLDVFGHDGDALCMDGTQVRVLEKTDQISLAGFLQGHDGGTLESQVCLEVLSYFTDETLKRQLADEQLRAFLVTPDFSKSHRSRPVTMRFLDATGGRCALPCSFRC